jgi:hypothetical protein
MAVANVKKQVKLITDKMVMGRDSKRNGVLKKTMGNKNS